MVEASSKGSEEGDRRSSFIAPLDERIGAAPLGGPVCIMKYDQNDEIDEILSAPLDADPPSIEPGVKRFDSQDEARTAFSKAKMQATRLIENSAGFFLVAGRTDGTVMVMM